jgi:hypothetical protein
VVPSSSCNSGKVIAEQLQCSPNRNSWVNNRLYFITVQQVFRPGGFLLLQADDRSLYFSALSGDGKIL